MNKEPKVTLLSWTNLPLETVYSVWMASKDDEPLLLPEQVRDSVSREEIEKLFKAVIAQRIPVGEHIDFVFMLENVSISWREQAVRHRIGVEISPERIGVDIIPDLAKSSWWSQSHRIRDVSGFADAGEYRMPASIANDDVSKRLYRDTMRIIQNAYAELVAFGIPMEDARELIPLGAQHRISWKLNVGALQHIVEKRGCWILQLGVWGPIIMGMISELVNKISPIFSELVKPPCIDPEGDFINCKFEEECRRRLVGEDELPPCPLHAYYYSSSWNNCEYAISPPLDIGEMALKMKARNIPMINEMVERAAAYEVFWQRDVTTGRRLNK